MERAQAFDIVSRLAAAHPRTKISVATTGIYADALADCTFEEADAAIRRLLGRSPYFPSVAEIRLAVAEARLNLPTPERAWDAARQAAERPRTLTPCANCGSSGFTDADWTVVCPACNGAGEREQPDATVHPLVRRAFASLGGRYAFATTTEPSIFRAQFLKSYASMRVEAIEAEAA